MFEVIEENGQVRIGYTDKSQKGTFSLVAAQQFAESHFKAGELGDQEAAVKMMETLFDVQVEYPNVKLPKPTEL